MGIEITRMSLNISRVEKQALCQLASAERETMSVTLRRILRDELRRKGFLEDFAPSSSAKELNERKDQ